MKLRGKVAVITGGSEGIGFGCARAFARHGCAVVFGSRRQDAGLAAERELNGAGYQAAFVQTDAGVAAEMERLIETAVERFSRLDCMVNNVGFHPPAETIDSVTVESFEQLLHLNVTSTFLGCKLALPHLRKSCGSIINISSKAALLGQAEAVRYVTTKAAQIGLTMSLALDLASERIRVNAVCPAGVHTPMWDDWAASLGDRELALEMARRAHPIGRLATIDEIGEVCAFLASDEASFITGQTICPDGGAGLGFRA
jgi:NAD(P)-dependent dehydrogenase (short-subunit alcohol dehydrogenase family)